MQPGFSVDMLVLFAIPARNAFGRRRCKMAGVRRACTMRVSPTPESEFAYGRVSLAHFAMADRRASHHKRSDVRKATSHNRRPADGAINARTTSHSAWFIGERF